MTAVYISMSDRWKLITGESPLHCHKICPSKCGPQENKTLIKFVTDCLWKYIGLINLIDGEAPSCPLKDLSTQYISVDTQ